MRLVVNSPIDPKRPIGFNPTNGKVIASNTIDNLSQGKWYNWVGAEELLKNPERRYVVLPMEFLE